MFNESRLLDCVAYGSEFGHRYNTRIDELKSGVERRNADWDLPLGTYSLIYQNINDVDFRAIQSAHHACKGRLVGFRFKDWADYTAEDEVIGFGDGTQQTYQLTKTYGFGSLSSAKNIYKPVQGSIVIKSNGSPVTPDSIDYTTGEVTLTGTSGHEITWSGEFDVPVRFDSDELGFSIDNRSGEVFIYNNDIQLVEIRV